MIVIITESLLFGTDSISERIGILVRLLTRKPCLQIWVKLQGKVTVKDVPW